MDFMTGVVASGVLYDMIKHGLAISAENIKAKFQGWIIDDTLAKQLEEGFSKLKLNNDMSESAIERKIDSSAAILELLSKVQPSVQTKITQTHYGTGDNVAGNKIINS